jgi:hypothetical protein
MKRFPFFMVSLWFGLCTFSLPGFAAAVSCKDADLIVQNGHLLGQIEIRICGVAYARPCRLHPRSGFFPQS